MGFILIPVLGSEVGVGSGVEQKGGNSIRNIKELSMKHVVKWVTVGMRKGATQLKHIAPLSNEPTHGVCATLCAFD